MKIELHQSILTLIVENSKISFAGHESKKGIGLNNLRKRLQLLYPSGHLLEFADQQDMFMAKLVIDL